MQKSHNNDDNRVALSIDAGNYDEAVLRMPIPTNRKQAREIAQVKQRLWMDEPKMGFSGPLYLHCWCGEQLLLDYFVNGVAMMTEKVQRFCHEHEGCEPKEEGENSA